MKKLIKRGFAALLALTLALGMSVSAFAVDETAEAKAVAEKDYQLANAKYSYESPAETFQFTVAKASVTDATNSDGTAVTREQMPDLTIEDVSYAAGAAGSAENSKQPLVVTTPATAFPSVGIYTYTVTEKKGDTVGVTYSEQELTLIATVYYESDYTKEKKVSYVFKDAETKNPDIVNTYSAGFLQVGKHVSGTLGNKEQKFNFTVTFTAPEGQTVNSTITYQDGKQTITPEAFKTGNGTVQVRISLADGDTETFKNVPYGVNYTVVEDEYDGYVTTYGSDAKGIMSKPETVAAVNNTKNGGVDTGVILHSAPYVLLLVGVGAAAVAFLILKKHREV